jgi:hypothetical protein
MSDKRWTLRIEHWALCLLLVAVSAPAPTASASDTRYAIEADTGEIIYVQNAGMRQAAPAVMERLLKGEAVDPALVYFRTVPAFETAAPDLQWLTGAIFIGTGERYSSEVVIRFWRVE